MDITISLGFENESLELDLTLTKCLQHNLGVTIKDLLIQMSHKSMDICLKHSNCHIYIFLG